MSNAETNIPVRILNDVMFIWQEADVAYFARQCGQQRDESRIIHQLVATSRIHVPLDVTAGLDIIHWFSITT